jgi:hypothetical protein
VKRDRVEPVFTRRAALGALAGSLACAWHASADEAPSNEAPANDALPEVAGETHATEEHKKPVPAPPRDLQQVAAAIERGQRFLLDDQNKNGSWGSAEQTKDLNIYAPVPAAHMAFRAGVTALAVSALCEVGSQQQEVRSAIDRGEAWLVANLPNLKRSSADALYNVWSHGYGIQALVRLHALRAGDAERQARLRETIATQIDLLSRFESIDGGWGYYDFRAKTQHPTSSSTSFQTAAVLVALHEAAAIGVPAPEKLVERALASVRRQLKPDFTYLYGEYLKRVPMHPVNQAGGSLGRSQACNLALRLYGDKRITDEVVAAWLNRLFARNLWLDLGRKRPVPHSSYYAVAGYFYYFGHYYAALCIELLPADQRGPHCDQLWQRLHALQEKDGSWWDYPLYNYHQQYGTAFALMSLVRCRA